MMASSVDICEEENKQQNIDADNCQLIDLIVHQKDAFFKSQQKGEEDISDSEKRTIVTDLFHSNRCHFLHRYGKYLDAQCLDRLGAIFAEDHNEDVDVQIRDLKERLKHKESVVKNRRYKAMQKLLSEGNYFSNSEMQSRNPYLFEQMVGQYMSNEEQKELQESSYKLNYESNNFSSFLMEQIRSMQLKCQYMVDEHVDQQEEEEDDDEDEEHEDEELETEGNVRKPADITPENKEMFVKEFRVQMMENFLMGKDKNFFDYNQVDNNEDYDMSEEMERDQEDKYFDDD